MSIEVLDSIIYVSFFVVLVPVFLLAPTFKRQPPEIKWYAAVLLAHFATGVSSHLLWRNGVNPNYASSVFYTFTILLYAKFFLAVLNSAQVSKRLSVILICHVVFGIINMLFIQRETINTYTGISFALIVISLSLHFFYSLLKELPTENLLELPVFWIVTAEFMVNTGQMLFKSFAHFLINIFNDNLIILWVLHHGLALIGHFVILYGVWLQTRRTSLKISATTKI